MLTFTNSQFRKKTLGYDKINVTATKTLNSLFNNLQSTAKWYPGEGEPVIDFLISVTTFLQASRNLADLNRASISFDNILTILLKNNSVVNEKVRTIFVFFFLQNIIIPVMTAWFLTITLVVSLSRRKLSNCWK